MALILFDLDGTILKDSKIQDGIIDVIKKLKKDNHIVGIATGRSPVFLGDFDKELGADNLILSNGTYVKADGKVIFERSFPEDVIKRMMRLSDEMHFDLGIVYLDEYKAYRRDQENVDIFSDIFKIVKPPFDRAYYPNRKIFAMQIFDTEMVPILEKEMPELIFNRANQYGYDINLKGDLKADGVRILMDYFKIKSEDIYAFGDGINDVSMIKLAGHGIAMGNACEELKSVADYITDNVDDNGIINALKHFKLI